MAKRFRGLEILKTIVLKRIRTDINQTITGKVQYKQRQERVTNNHEFKQMINAWKTDRLTARNRSCQRQSILSFHCRCGVFFFVVLFRWKRFYSLTGNTYYIYFICQCLYLFVSLRVHIACFVQCIRILLKIKHFYLSKNFHILLWINSLNLIEYWK